MISTSIIICTKDRPSKLKLLLNSLFCQTLMPSEVIVVDASISSQSKNVVESINESNRIVMKYLHTSPSLTHQRNKGVALASGDLLFFFDDDIILHPEFIKVVDETYSIVGDQAFGGMMGHMANAECEKKGKRDYLDRILKKIFLLSEISNGKMKPSGFPSQRNDQRFCRVGVMPGGYTIYHRKVFDFESFDEVLKGYAYMEDVDFSFRVNKRFSLWYQPLAIIEHYPTTYKSSDTRLLRRMMIQNHSYIFRKNFPKSFPHIGAHLWSILGVFVYNLLFSRDWRGAFGTCEGFFLGTILKYEPRN